MMTKPRWKLFIRGNRNYEDLELPSTPGWYEFSIRRSRGRYRVVYAGSSANLKQRIETHGNGDSATNSRIWMALRHGYGVYVRFHRTRSLVEAFNAEQRRVLNRKEYPWNLKLRGKYRGPWK